MILTKEGMLPKKDNLDTQVTQLVMSHIKITSSIKSFIKGKVLIDKMKENFCLRNRCLFLGAKI